MLPRIGSSKFVSTWLVITLGLSIAAMLDGGWLVSLAALVPQQIWRGQVWRLVTWVLVDPHAMSLILTCVVFYKFAGELAPRWGDRRLRRFIAQVVITAGVVTAIVALAADHAWRIAHTGGWALGNALVIAWARQYPAARLRLYGFLELGGQNLVWFTIGVTTLLAISSSPLVMAPELVACILAAMYPREWLAR